MHPGPRMHRLDAGPKKDGASLCARAAAGIAPPHTVARQHRCPANNQNDIGTRSISVTSGVSRVRPAPTATLSVFLSVRR